MEYYSAIKKNEILPLATTWMELEGIMLSEVSQRKTNIIRLKFLRTVRNKCSENGLMGGFGQKILVFKISEMKLFY